MERGEGPQGAVRGPCVQRRGRCERALTLSPGRENMRSGANPRAHSSVPRAAAVALWRPAGPRLGQPPPPRDAPGSPLRGA